MLIIFIVLAFLVGIFIGRFTAPYVTPQSPTTVIVVLLPFFFLYFFSEIPLINQIRYIYFSLAIGIFVYWTYFQIQK